MSNELDAFSLVLDHICSDRGMVRDLFNKEIGTTTTILVGPVTVEEPTMKILIRLLRMKNAGRWNLLAKNGV